MVEEYDVLTVFRRLALVGKTADKSVTVSKSLVRDLLRLLLVDRFDEKWYLERYPDVADALGKGMVDSGLDHYTSSGVYEGRVPYPVALDEKDYLMRHRDVARALREGPYTSGAEHFYTVGFLEGRGFKIDPDRNAARPDDAKAETTAQ